MFRKQSMDRVQSNVTVVRSESSARTVANANKFHLSADMANTTAAPLLLASPLRLPHCGI
ncbi:hypothetical protein KUV22_14660 [Microbulbifer agarilyticus]|uniref:hypothetical protein n=1 Tax=Microbulbifer agarilyticus TaxID=260552 RepID=UPI001C98B439|nr:hypothetical protein [Microbulbifer agarilyticus]MBY6191673.1 hypothetical protein [Microbulbifer agarilyticus]